MPQKLRVYARDMENPDLHCIVLHGFGADAQDVIGVSQEIHTTAEVDYLFPQAPYQITVQGQRYGTAWFPRSQDEVMQALTGDYFVGLARLDPPALQESVKEVLAFIQDAKLDWNKLVVSGFSQGAMIAAELALRAPQPPAGLAVLSGSLVAHARWEKLAAELPGRWGDAAEVPLFQSHGIQDPILDVVSAEALHELLLSSVFHGKMRTFAGGHTIPEETLQEFSGFLDICAGVAEARGARQS